MTTKNNEAVIESRRPWVATTLTASMTSYTKHRYLTARRWNAGILDTCNRTGYRP